MAIAIRTSSSVKPLWILDSGCGMRDAGCALRVAGCGLPDTGYWMLDTGCWSLASGSWQPVTGWWFPVSGIRQHIFDPGPYDHSDVVLKLLFNSCRIIMLLSIYYNIPSILGHQPSTANLFVIINTCRFVRIVQTPSLPSSSLHPASRLSGIRYPASISSIQHPASSIQHPIQTQSSKLAYLSKNSTSGRNGSIRKLR